MTHRLDLAICSSTFTTSEFLPIDNKNLADSGKDYGGRCGGGSDGGSDGGDGANGDGVVMLKGDK